MHRILVLALCVSLPLPVLAAEAKVKLPAQYARNAGLSDADRLQSAARFLVAAQRELKSPDGKRSLAATWPFQPKGEVAAPNASGIVARALLSAGGPEARPAAEAWGRARLADVAADHPIFDPDVETLALLAQAGGEKAFLAGAKQAFEVRHGMANGREIVERLFLVRRGAPSLVGFDAALSARAALAVGEREKATEIVQALAATTKRWDKADERGFDLTSRAAVLEVALTLGSDKALSGRLCASLVAEQQKDGAWGQRNTQATAYTVRALRGCGSPEAEAAVERGRRFLRLTQLESGGWGTFNDYLPEPFVGETVYEVTAEVMLALEP